MFKKETSTQTFSIQNVCSLHSWRGERGVQSLCCFVGETGLIRQKEVVRGKDEVLPPGEESPSVFGCRLFLLQAG